MSLTEKSSRTHDTLSFIIGVAEIKKKIAAKVVTFRPLFMELKCIQ